MRQHGYWIIGYDVPLYVVALISQRVSRLDVPIYLVALLTRLTLRKPSR